MISQLLADSGLDSPTGPWCVLCAFETHGHNNVELAYFKAKGAHQDP